MSEKLRCAAVWWKHKNGSYHATPGMTWAECKDKAKGFHGINWLDRDESKDRYGFITTKDRYVDYLEGIDIAEKEHQLKIAKEFLGGVVSPNIIEFALESPDDEVKEDHLSNA